MPETYTALFGDTKVNLVCTDPPYLVNLESTSGKIKNDDLDDEKGYEFLKSAFERFKEFMAKDASIYVFYARQRLVYFMMHMKMRVCFGVELEPKFVDVAVERYIKLHEGRSDDVYLMRNGERIEYKDVEVSDE